MSALFFAMYVPFFLLENTTTEIDDQAGFGSFGFISMSIIYTLMMIGGLICPSICAAIGLKASFVIGGLLCTMAIFS